MMTTPNRNELTQGTAGKSYREVWFWSLAPIATMLLLVILWWMCATAKMNGFQGLFTILFFIQGLFFIASWIGFGFAVAKRCMNNWGVVLLSLLYPVLQAAVQVTIFFGGCVKVMKATDFRLHGYEDNHQQKEAVSENRNDLAQKSAEPLQVSQQVVSLSAVSGVPSQSQTLTITNPHSERVDCKTLLQGVDAGSFALGAFPDKLSAGESHELSITFTPDPNAESVRLYSAGLNVGDRITGTHVVLQGLGQVKFEGENEPTLELIIHGFGIPLDVGGSDLHLDTTQQTIGDSVEVSYFKAIKGKKVTITPLARFSPRGLVGIGIFRGKATALDELAKLADTSKKHPDAHQCLLPPLVSGTKTIEFAPGHKPFGVYIKGGHYQIATDQAQSKTSKVKHGVRVYPVKIFQGRQLENAYLLGFEEAANGDYQDTLLLMENVELE